MKKQHRDQRGLEHFDAHTRKRAGDDPLRRRAWRFRREDPAALDPHCRKTYRMAALPGKHVRQVKEPVRSTHGKVS